MDPFGLDRVIDPIKLAKTLWPDVHFYRKQREIIYSVHENDETVVPAGNMLGKDFVSGFIVLWFFLSRSPCRIVTTSADHSQLEAVLWGEIRRFIQTAKYPLDSTRGGPLVVNHLHLRKMLNPATGLVCPRSYATARVAAKGEGLLGHHIEETGDGIPRTLMLADEGSGVEDMAYERSTTWARRVLVIGNPYPCDNFFKRAVKGDGEGDPGGDRPRVGAPGYYRKVIQIKATDSPNVQLGLAEQRAGRVPSGKVILPGVLPWHDYMKRRATWDKVRQCVSLDAEFYEGAEVLLFPPDWLDRAQRYWATLVGTRRRARAIGIDPAEGGDETSMVAVDEHGVIEVLSRRTPNTADIPREALAFMTRHRVPAHMVFFDRGGGGKQHADQLASRGHDVRTVGFGEAASYVPQERPMWRGERVEEAETRYAYVNRRAEMYGLLSQLLDPGRDGGLGQECDVGVNGFALPPDAVLRKQLAPVPKLYDAEGRLRLPPKSRKAGTGGKEKTLIELIGHSPDRADALVLATWGMIAATRAAISGAG